ncbi:MAG: sigma-54-dependent Fis family transcriptional regulator [Candidatus Eisenbacteria bacterium]|uniref:Sigma-54-dependent Fis family transcriptional regulator n=1 Tax=Eiseniibacteriota bacterium TaxID=2212470 RepID=A0A956M0U0_UNCEI|nr:sigma-54-dependent Fis family transcriptional regulator [Candidatus Eisenbacteria bacterium]
MKDSPRKPSSDLIEDQSEYIVGASDAMKRVLRLAEKIAPTETTVLITGESGTGKEKIARFIHLQSARARYPFLAVNAAAIAEGLIESELFGHVRGAFTDARDRKRGFFELADRGTLFLDEIAETSHSVQVRLLRALQEREIRPVGADAIIKIDVRIVAATNRDLRQAMNEGRFREDLFYRLNVFRIHLPPLRERKDDIPYLAEYFVRLYAERNRKELEGISDQAMGYLLNYDYPGNIRELENAIERAVTLVEGPRIQPTDLPPEIYEGGIPLLTGGRSGNVGESFPDNLTLEELERRYILHVLDRMGGNMTRAAKSLGISRSTLWRKVGKYGISVEGRG